MGYRQANSEYRQASAIFQTVLILLIGALVYSCSQTSACFKRWESVSFTFNTLKLKAAASPLEIWTRFPEGENDAFSSTLVISVTHRDHLGMLYTMWTQAMMKKPQGSNGSSERTSIRRIARMGNTLCTASTTSAWVPISTCLVCS